MAKLAEERAGEDSRRRAARDIISSAIRTGNLLYYVMRIRLRFNYFRILSVQLLMI